MDGGTDGQVDSWRKEWILFNKKMLRLPEIFFMAFKMADPRLCS